MTRIPEGLRRRLEREAKGNRRSMNAEIVERLGASFAYRDQVEAITANVELAVEAALLGFRQDLDGIRSDIRAIWARLDAAPPKQ